MNTVDARRRVDEAATDLESAIAAYEDGHDLTDSEADKAIKIASMRYALAVQRFDVEARFADLATRKADVEDAIHHRDMMLTVVRAQTEVFARIADALEAEPVPVDVDESEPALVANSDFIRGYAAAETLRHMAKAGYFEALGKLLRGEDD